MQTIPAELIVVSRGSHMATEQRSLSRDVERGLLVRIRRGAYLLRSAWEAMSPEQRHLLSMQALAAVSNEAPVFSHWSAAVALGLPILDRRRLSRVHVLIDPGARRTVHGAAPHLLPVSSGEIERSGTLLVTGVARSVVDIAAAAHFVEGVVTADGALRAGTRRTALEEALEAVGVRRGLQRARAVVGFAHPGAESAAESLSRVTMLRLHIVPLVLQHEVHDRRGLAGRLDFWDPLRRSGGEVDGAKKYLDPALALRGAGRAVYDEKLREDRVRACIDRLARWGWKESGDPLLLGPVLAAAGILPAPHGATLQDYIAAARPFG